MTMAMATTKAKATSRERGTLQKTLPNPSIIKLIFLLVSTAIATYISHYSTAVHASTNANVKDDMSAWVAEMAMVGGKAALGAASSIVAFSYNDPFVHLTSFTGSVSTCSALQFNCI